eukprot:Hpha_TRINITY_DN14925_c0_g6::TRINITY_DN14925_c0_g6_i1::g.144963::m.144963/K10396/KIF5; kinesin family member 5
MDTRARKLTCSTLFRPCSHYDNSKGTWTPSVEKPRCAASSGAEKCGMAGDVRTERRERVKVFARLRPSVDGASLCLERVDERTVRLSQSREYTFDAVFTPEAGQDAVFAAVGAPAVERVLQGYNATVFVYGQTGSGKTHTMMAPEGGRAEMLAHCLSPQEPLYQQRGVIPRAVEALLEQMAGVPGHVKAWLSASYYEIYMEDFFDLLADGERKTQGGRCSGARFHIRGLGDLVDLGTCTSRDEITTVDEVLALLREGARRRHISRTAANEFSSRSHAVLRLRLRQQNRASGAVKESELNLTDLAGSERVGKAETAGLTAAEGRKINLSLSWLGTVVREICDQREYVHYLDSKLTRVLQNSIGGNALTSLICTVSASAVSAEETKTTLEFGAHAARVRNVAHVGEQLSEGQLRLLVRRLQEEAGRMRQQLEHKRRYSGPLLSVANSGRDDDELDAALDASQREVRELQEQVRLLELDTLQNADLALSRDPFGPRSARGTMRRRCPAYSERRKLRVCL